MQLVQMWTQLAEHNQDEEADIIISGGKETSLSAAHTAIGVLSITSGKCQQEFRTTRRSSTARKVWGFGNADELKEENFFQSYPQTCTNLPPPQTHTYRRSGLLNRLGE